MAKLRSPFSSRQRRLLDRLALAGCAVLSVNCERTSTLSVTNTTDGERDSLRHAVSNANASGSSTVRIEIAAGTYALTRCGASEDGNDSGDLDLTRVGAVTLVAVGGSVIIRQTCPGERVLDSLGAGTLTLQGVQVTGGSLTASDPSEPARGGGVRAEGNVVLAGALITGNAAQGAPGRAAAAGAAGVPGGAALGGGLFVGGSLTADYQTLVSLNDALGGAGAHAAADAPVASAGGAAEGGGAYVVGAITLTGSRWSENEARAGAGGSALQPAAGGSARGGGLAQAQTETEPAALASTRFESNLAQGGDSGGVTESTGSVVGSSAGAGEGGGAALSGPVTASTITATLNRAVGGGTGFGSGPLGWGRGPGVPGSAYGGALWAGGALELSFGDLTLNVAVSGDTLYQCSPRLGCFGPAASPAAGGAVYARGNLSALGGYYRNNTAKRGIGASNDDAAARGGALAAGGDNVLHVEGGEYHANAATGPYARLAGQARGGALSAAVVELVKVRLSSNTAEGAGGAVDAGTLRADELTATGNRASGSGGALYVTSGAQISRALLRDNIVDARSELAAQAVVGGGAARVGGTLVLVDSWIAGNSAESQVGFVIPGGTSTSFFPSLAVGGGIHAGSVLAQNVTVSGNRVIGVTVREGLPIPILRGTSGGGGIASSTAQLSNVTLSDNAVLAAADAPVQYPDSVQPPAGSALLTDGATLDHVTLIDNAGAETIRTTTLASARSVAISVPGTNVCAPGVVGASAVYSWFSDASCGLTGETNRQEHGAFLLGGFTSAVGAYPIPVRVPQPGSVLIDQIPTAECRLGVDARGVARPQGPACDIGAAEAML